MASHKAFLCWFLFFGIVGLGLHLAGFVFPGWIVMRTRVEKITFDRMFLDQQWRQPIDDGGLPNEEMPRESPPMMPDDRRMEDDKPRPMHDEGHHGRQARDAEDRDMEMMEKPHEELMIQDFFRVVTADVEDFEVSVHYGLWCSRVCVHLTKHKEETMIEEDEVIDDVIEDEDDETGELIIDKRDASSSSSDEDGHRKHGKHHGRKCHCKKVSTKCALKMASLFESPFCSQKRRLSVNNMANASLKEHQIEATIGLILFALGVLGGIMSFRKADGCRCVKAITMIFLLVAIALIAVPVIRMASYAHYRSNMKDGVNVSCPYSAIFSSSACSLALLAAIVTFVGTIAQGRKERAGRWYQFNNELEAEEKKKGPALVFYNDPYPVKAGLVDVCDFSDIKPQEEMEPEKKPLE